MSLVFGGRPHASTAAPAPGICQSLAGASASRATHSLGARAHPMCGRMADSSVSLNCWPVTSRARHICAGRGAASGGAQQGLEGSRASTAGGRTRDVHPRARRPWRSCTPHLQRLVKAACGEHLGDAVLAGGGLALGPCLGRVYKQRHGVDLQAGGGCSVQHGGSVGSA